MLILTSCSSNGTVTGKAVSDDHTPIKIGHILPLTGNQAYVGKVLKIGGDLAVEEINSKGGVNGRPIQILYEDDQADPKQAVTAFTKLTEMQGVKVIMPELSGSTIAVAPLAEQEKIISFSPIASSTKVAKAGDYTFRIREKGSLHGEAAADYMIAQGWTRVALLVVAHENGASYADAFTKRFNESGGSILLTQTYSKDSADFKTELTKIKEMHPDAIYLAGFAKEVGEQLKQAKEIGLKTNFVTTPGAEDDQLLTIAGESAEGLVYTYPLIDLDRKEVQDFLAKYHNRSRSDALIFGAMNTYDSLHILANVMEKCGQETPCIQTELYSIKDYPGIGGNVTFDSDGEVQKQIMIKIVRNGKFEQINGGERKTTKVEQ